MIYHLNTRNDDHQEGIDALNKSHETEIEDILKDASNKLNQFKLQLDAKKKEGDVAKKLEVLKGQHQKEKADAMAEFAAYKKDVKEREVRLKGEFQNRLESVNGQLEDVRNSFERRLQQFAEVSASMAKKATNKEELDKLREEHAREIASHVRDHNTKFNEMLMEQMSAQESMKEKHDVEVESLRSSMQNQHQRELDALRSQLEKERRDSMELAHKAWTVESAEALKACKADYDTKINAMLADLQSSKAECKRLEDEAKRTGSSSAELCTEISSLKEELERLHSQIVQKDRHTEGIEKQLATVSQDLKDALGKLHALEDAFTSQTSQLEAVRNEVKEKAKTIDSLNAEMKGLKANSASQAGSLEGELKKCKSELERKNQEIQTLEAKLDKDAKAHSAALSKARTSAEEEKAGLTKEIEKLQSQIEVWKGKAADAQKSASSSSSESAARIKELEAELKRVQKEMLDQLKKAAEEAASAMSQKLKEVSYSCL